MSSKFSRKELYDLVWSKPVSQIIKEYSISNSTFKALCKDNNIPLPKNGHWQKIKHNKKINVIPLPELDEEQGEICLKEDLKPLSKLNELVRTIKNDKSLPLKVPKNFNKTNGFVVRAKQYYNAVAKAKYQSRVEKPKEGIITVHVSKTLERRAYLFADTLIKLMKARGHDFINVTNSKHTSGNGDKLVVFGERYDIRILEPDYRVTKKHPTYSWNETKYYPTGKLMLKLDDLYGRTWVDTENKLLEDKLPNILAYFELRAKREIKERIDREIWHKEYERKKKLEEELKKVREKELEDFKSLINSSGRWYKSQNLRDYLDTFEAKAKESGTLDNLKIEWLKWARKKADWYDPFIESDDETFKGIDRNDF